MAKNFFLIVYLTGCGSEMLAAVTEYSEALARRLVERITIFDGKIVVELKSGLQMEVEE